MKQTGDDSSTYKKLSDQERILRLRELQKQLPVFCAQFFIGIEPRTSTLTRLNYAHDLRVFFRFLSDSIPAFKDYADITQFALSDLDRITVDDIYQFISFLSYYQNPDGQVRDNDEAGKERKLSCIRSLYKHFLKKERITTNPAALVDAPKRHEKPIIRLEPNEAVRILNAAETGAALGERAKKFHSKTALRDLALLTLMLGTGIRVSECIGINLSDLNFEDNSFRVTRKGGDQVILYFGDEVKTALSAYLEYRNKIPPAPGHEDALFLSLQKKRIDQRSVQNLVKKYAVSAAPLKKISPHKLRSTFGTELYKETGDIYLVADVLGHSDVNTTRKHYAAQSEENRRTAAQVIKLREP